eukprot:5031224-Lingulodinium_polyedra.AAC.1
MACALKNTCIADSAAVASATATRYTRKKAAMKKTSSNGPPGRGPALDAAGVASPCVLNHAWLRALCTRN